MDAALPPLVMPAHVGAHLKFALRRSDARDYPGALQGITAAALEDIQAMQQQFLGDVRACGVFSDVVQELLGAWIKTNQRAIVPQSSDGPVRLLYFVPNLSVGQAASMNLVRLVEWHLRNGLDGARVEPSVIICDELTQRRPALGYIKFEDRPTEMIGAELVARLRKLCPVRILGVDGNFLDAATEGINLGRAFGPDVAFFIGSPACAVQTAIAAARVAPVQACLNIGVPMLSPGIDAVVYNNPSKETRDAAFIRSRGIEVHGVATSGGDAQVGAGMAPFPRRELGLPDGVPVAASMSNVLVRRMLAGTFARDLAGFLRRNQDAWWLGIGFCDPAPFYAYLDTLEGGADIRRRCVFAGGWTAPWGMVKSCQVLLNEYPEGGGNSVIETMGCGVPVVAMRAGPRHAESIGAELVGEDAIQTNDIEAYWNLAEKWLREPAAARAAGARQRERALAELDYGVICDKYERIAIDLCARRARAAAPASALAAAG